MSTITIPGCTNRDCRIRWPRQSGAQVTNGQCNCVMRLVNNRERYEIERALAVRDQEIERLHAEQQMPSELRDVQAIVDERDRLRVALDGEAESARNLEARLQRLIDGGIRMRRALEEIAALRPYQSLLGPLHGAGVADGFEWAAKIARKALRLIDEALPSKELQK